MVPSRLLFTTLAVLPHLVYAQIANLPDPDTRCTLGLCRPIGEIMATCIGDDATPENISWADLVSGQKVTVEQPNSGVKVDISSRLQCFCSSPGLERRLNNCNGCYVGTNQEEYWSTGINHITDICGFTESAAPVVSSKRAQMAAVGVAAGVGLSLVVVDVLGITV